MSKSDRVGTNPAARQRVVVLVSPLPPPAGGIAVWTETLLRRGLPGPWRIRLVDTRMRGRAVAETEFNLPVEALRAARIVLALTCALLRRRDLVHLNASLSPSGVFRDWAVVALSRLFQAAVVVNLRGGFIMPSGRGMAARLGRAAYTDMFRRAAAVVPLSGTSLDEVLRAGNFADKTEIIPNFIDLSEFQGQAAAGGPPGEFTALYAGALLPTKGVDTIIEAAALATGVHFVLIGDAPPIRREQLRSRAEALRVQGRVRFAGPLPHKAVLEEMAGASGYVLPSQSEGFPVSVAEAMASGLPVVAAPVGAIPSMIEDGVGGMLVSPGDAAGLAAALEMLRTDPALAARMGAHNRQKAEREYAFDVVVRRWTALYERVATGKAGRRSPRAVGPNAHDRQSR